MGARGRVREARRGAEIGSCSLGPLVCRAAGGRRVALSSVAREGAAKLPWSLAFARGIRVCRDVGLGEGKGPATEV